MPVYIIHGFRWPRAGFTGIRVHIILQNIDDAAAEYVQSSRTQRAILANFRSAFPEIMEHLPNLCLIEQHDPADLSSEAAVSQPYAYVADKVVTIADASDDREYEMPPDPLIGSKKSGAKAVPFTGGGLSINVEDVVAAGTGLAARGWEAMADLRDKIAAGEKIGWWVVYNGDPERYYEGMDEEDEDDNVIEEEDEEAEEMEDHDEDSDKTPEPVSKIPTPSVPEKKMQLRSGPPVSACIVRSRFSLLI